MAEIGRRGFLIGLGAALAAPAIIPVERLMLVIPPKAVLLPTERELFIMQFHAMVMEAWMEQDAIQHWFPTLLPNGSQRF